MSSWRAIQAVTIALLLGICACSRAGPDAVDNPASSFSPGARPAVDLSGAAQPLTGRSGDYDAVVAAASGATRILLGESTHGTHEFYRERARITERLIGEAGALAVLIEGDWSATWAVNLYVRGEGGQGSAERALAGFDDFPRWMWGNTDFRDFVERLRTSNLGRAPKDRVGVYGMDVYDLFDAADAVVAYLHTVDSAAAARAQSRYACFAAYRASTHAYGQAAVDPARSCQRAATAVRDDVARLPAPAALPEIEHHFGAVRAAVSVAAAEEYFRTLYTGGRAWNVRDQQMSRNVDDIAAHVARLSGRTGKVITWSHNTHTGDARATEAAQRGELNLGQLMRERHGDAAFLVGFLSYAGRVMAAPEWDRPGRVYEMPPARPDSHAALLKSSGIPAFSLVLRGNTGLAETLAAARLQRAIGVVYAVEVERIAHYIDARLSPQFDAVVFIETTAAVTPLGK